MEQAVVDRVEGDLAVLLVGADEQELLVPIRDLPKGSGPGVWLKVTIEGNSLKQAEVDWETTRTRQARIQVKMDRLLGKRPET
jgi:hypothetical protein